MQSCHLPHKTGVAVFPDPVPSVGELTPADAEIVGLVVAPPNELTTF